MIETRCHPRHVGIDASEIVFRLMSRVDEPAVCHFARQFPTYDFPFLPRQTASEHRFL
jgi:hypothetical protein